MNTLGELAQAVALSLNRTDQDFNVPMWVRLAEADIYRNLQCPDNEFYANYTSTYSEIVGQPPTPGPGQFRQLPSNFSSMRQVMWEDRVLQPVSDAQLEHRRAINYDSVPTVYAIVNRVLAFSSKIKNDPADWDPTSVLSISYWGTESLTNYPTWQVSTNPVENPVVEDVTPEALVSSSENTTRMLQRNPDVYLYGTLYHAAVFMRDDTKAMQWGTMFNKALSDLKAESKRNRYAGGTKQVINAYEV